MSSLLSPFDGFVPAAEFASRVVGPPSSLLKPGQKEATKGDPLSFRHAVGRGARAPHDTAVQWLQACTNAGALNAIDRAVIVHRSTYAGASAIGLIANVSVAGFDQRRVKPHEKTLAKTEQRMLDYMQSTRILGNPVALTHRDHDGMAQGLARHSQGLADVEFTSIDGTEHQLWVVSGDPAAALCQSFEDDVYITDGHHRMAAASLLAKAEGLERAAIPGALFAESELRLWAFARTVRCEAARPGDIVEALQRRFALTPVDARVPRPQQPHQFGVRLGGASYLLTVPDEMIPSEVGAQLDVNLLQQHILEPLFGIADPRADERLGFVADTGDQAHEPDDFDAWFLPFPTAVDDVMTIADLGQTMPPKSTFFLPKVPSGLAVRLLDQ